MFETVKAVLFSHGACQILYLLTIERLARHLQEKQWEIQESYIFDGVHYRKFGSMSPKIGHLALLALCIFSLARPPKKTYFFLNNTVLIY